jgi:hypothetical protein
MTLKDMIEFLQLNQNYPVYTAEFLLQYEKEFLTFIEEKSKSDELEKLKVSVPLDTIRLAELNKKEIK